MFYFLNFKTRLRTAWVSFIKKLGKPRLDGSNKSQDLANIGIDLILKHVLP